LNSNFFFSKTLLFQFRKKLIDHKTGLFNLLLLFEYEDLYFNSEKIAFEFKIIIWIEPWISIPNYYFGFSKLILKVWILLIESKNWHFNFEYCYLDLNFLFKQKNLFDLKIDIWILNYYFRIKI